VSKAIAIRPEIALPVFVQPDKLEKAKLLINQLGKNLHEHAYLIGKLLIWVQSQTKSKEIFEAWVEENIWFGIRTGRHFIAHAKKCEQAGEILEYHPAKQLHSGATIAPISGEYKTVIIDPPWPIEKVERTERPLQAAENTGLDYPTMTIEAIQNSKYPFSENCHVYLWTTQKFLPTSFQLFEAWDVKYIQTLVWHKNVGFTPFGLFMNNVEFVLFGRRGSLPLLRAGLKVCFEGKVREHSRKPDEFYDLVKTASPEPRIDIFSREKRDGFDQWGNDIEKF
jgi:N6-adenosine-specific RNA methylase IME4